jgi:hypothetical protein
VADRRNKGRAERIRGAAGVAALAISLLLTLPTTAPVRAESGSGVTSTKAVLVAVRTLGFVLNPPTGAVDLAVVYDPSQPASLADLKTVTTTLTNGTAVGAAVVRPVPVPVAELSRIKSFHFVLLVGGLQPWFSTVADLVHGQGILTISTDLGCVRAGQCVMGVAVEPRVQVLVNRVAAQAAAVDFAVSFRMMITEL